jgi:hypothetical protein
VVAKKRKKKGMRLEDRPVVESRAAGIDVGAREVYVACRLIAMPSRYKCLQPSPKIYNGLTDWLIGCGAKTVAMESTGVYWIPLFEMLEV